MRVNDKFDKKESRLAQVNLTNYESTLSQFPSISLNNYDWNGTIKEHWRKKLLNSREIWNFRYFQVAAVRFTYISLKRAPTVYNVEHVECCDDEFYNFEKWYTQRGPVSRRIHLLSGWNFRYQPDDEQNSRSYENRSRFQWKLYASVDNIWNSQVRTELDTGIFLITPVFQTKLLYLVAIRFSSNHARPSNRSFV